jgi:hypothetical protein
MVKYFYTFFFSVFSLYSFSQTQSYSLTNKWKFNVEIDGFGSIEFLLDIKQNTDSTFEASSRLKAIKDIISYKQFVLAKLFTQQYKNGAFVHVLKGQIVGDTLRGVFIGPQMAYYLNAIYSDNQIQGTLGDDKFGKNKKISHSFSAAPFSYNQINYNFSNLDSSIKKTFEKNFYNPHILKEKEWIEFFRKLNKVSNNAHDDLEFFIGFSNLSKNIKTSHIGILKNNPWNDLEQLNNRSYVTIKKIDSTISYIKFEGFALQDSNIVRSFFDSIIENKIPNLIIDLRGCGGGDYSSMTLSSYFIKKSLNAGFFVGNKYFNNNEILPSNEFLKNKSPYTGNSLREFLDEIINTGLLIGKVEPDKNLNYNGNVIVLIDKFSASATEPIVYFLKQNNLATIIGEKTAGQMLSSTVIDVKDGWTLLIPIADYYTSDRYRIENNGVKPNIKIKSEDALEYSIQMIFNRNNEKRNLKVKGSF